MRSVWCCALALVALAAATEAQTYGDWYVLQGERETIGTNAVTSVPAGRAHTPMLVMTCAAGELGIGYGWGKLFLGNRDKQVAVGWMVDTRDADRPALWDMVRNNGAGIGGIAATRWLQNIRSGNRILLLVMDPADGETLGDLFSLHGLTAALQHLSCARGLR
jgi:hypothetical protein